MVFSSLSVFYQSFHLPQLRNQTQILNHIIFKFRANLPTAMSKVENFQQIFPRAKSMQAKAGILAAVHSAAACIYSEFSKFGLHAYF